MLQIVLTQALSRAERNRPSLQTRIATWTHAQWQGYQARRRYRKTVQTLSGLDDRTLHDIGLHRSEIESYGWTGGTGRHPERFTANNGFPRG